MSNLGFHCHRLAHIETGILENDLRRGEFYHFPSYELPALKKSIYDHKLAASIHAPLVRPEWYPEPPTWSFLCDVDKNNRNLTLRMIQETLAMAGDLGAEYVVVHFPCPTTAAAGESPSKLEAIAWSSADRLAEFSAKHNLAIHVEGFSPSPFLTPEFLSQILGQFPPLRYCFDAGHMNIAAHRIGFDLYDFARQMVPYLGSIHLWNNRSFEDYEAFRHIPVHPSQKPEEGWVDIKKLLEALTGDQSRCPIIFESGHYYPIALGDHDYRDGVRWVKELLETSS